MSNSAPRHYDRQGVVELVLRREGEEAGAVTEVHSESRTDCIAAVAVAAVVDSVDDDDGVAVAGAGGSRSHGCSIEGTDYRTGHSDVHIEYNSAAAAAAVDSLDCLFLALAVGWGTY